MFFRHRRIEIGGMIYMFVVRQPREGSHTWASSTKETMLIGVNMCMHSVTGRILELPNKDGGLLSISIHNPTLVQHNALNHRLRERKLDKASEIESTSGRSYPGRPFMLGIPFRAPPPTRGDSQKGLRIQVVCTPYSVVE
ncbi:uncharacterized protein CIMG_13005 [Coccidioides immitis RS]|uniref:Uncharacterized protein n=1 Tax=Coccidioides immitis (strain RS) TaxID=246410 RepID=A0A0D8JT67_COCIM|nr:uncharacterized protein CIMG_13005 [Coccidioides immitis RS]KJF60487.1 hypothetical protein CIMG_13005 [Coccidioides immitis RS]